MLSNSGECVVFPPLIEQDVELLLNSTLLQM